MAPRRIRAVLVVLASFVTAAPSLRADEPAPGASADFSFQAEYELDVDSDATSDAQAAPSIPGVSLGDDQQKARVKDVESELADVLGRHRFCHADDYRLDLGDLPLCGLSSEAKERCPGIEKACQSPHLEDFNWDFSLGNLDLGDLAAVARAFFWTVILLGLAALIVSIARRVIATHADEEPLDESTELEADESPVPQVATETDVDRLLARARGAAERGDYPAAIRDAYAALLRKLDADGLIEIHRSRTNGDYRRRLRERAELHAEFSQISRTVEAVQFGSQAPTEQRWRAFFDKVNGIVGRTTIFLFLAASALVNSGCHERWARASDLGCGENPGGYSVLCEMLRVDGANVRRRIEKVDRVDDAVVQIIALPGTDLNESEWEVVDEWVKKGHTLVLAGGLSPMHKRLGVYLDPDRCNEPSEVAPGSTLFYGSDTRLATLREWPLETNTREVWAIVECDQGPTVLGMQHGEGTVLFLSNTALLTNVSMAAADNARFAVNLLSQSGFSVEVFSDWTGSGSQNPLEALSAANLTPWVLQLLVLGVLIGLWRGPHFGRPRDLTAEKRHAFVEHIQALGLRYARSKASGHVLASYAGWALGRLSLRLLPGEKRGLGELSTALARKTGRPESEVLQVLIAAKSAADAAHDNATVKEHLETMRQLEALLQSSGGSGERRSIL